MGPGYHVLLVNRMSGLLVAENSRQSQNLESAAPLSSEIGQPPPISLWLCQFKVFKCCPARSSSLCTAVSVSHPAGRICKTLDFSSEEDQPWFQVPVSPFWKVNSSSKKWLPWVVGFHDHSEWVKTTWPIGFLSVQWIFGLSSISRIRKFLFCLCPLSPKTSTPTWYIKSRDLGANAMGTWWKDNERERVEGAWVSKISSDGVSWNENGDNLVLGFQEQIGVRWGLAHDDVEVHMHTGGRLA